MFPDVGGALVIVGADHVAFEAELLDELQCRRLGGEKAIRAAFERAPIGQTRFDDATRAVVGAPFRRRRGAVTWRATGRAAGRRGGGGPGARGAGLKSAGR